MIVVIPWFVPVDRLEIDSAFGGKRIVVTMWLLDAGSHSRALTSTAGVGRRVSENALVYGQRCR